MAKNTTNQNKSKSERLVNEHVVPYQSLAVKSSGAFIKSLEEFSGSKGDILFSIGKKICGGNENPAYLDFISEYDFDEIEIGDIPTKEPDLLGAAYQFLNTKQDNLSQGSFYTGLGLARKYTSDLDFTAGQHMLDPSCGSGVFLFMSDAKPEQIVGVDFDPLAVMIAKFNYFAKFPDAPAPKIYCSDFFEWLEEHGDEKFDYIIGNPPFGADLDTSRIKTDYVTTGESFSYFIESCYPLLKDSGKMRFIVPEALLNVKRHKDIRSYILEKTNLVRIDNCKATFSGVMSEMYMIELDHGNNTEVAFDDGTGPVKVLKSLYESSPKKTFICLDPTSSSIVEKMENKGERLLAESTYALGVVTGGNKDKLFSEPMGNTEPIYTGKEIIAGRYSLLPAKNHLVYDRSKLQQVAPDWIYRSKSKLVYKVINKFLRFVIDETASLTTNAANIVIPGIDGMTDRVVLGILNSRAMSFYALKVFGGVNKVAKENLQALPIPVLDQDQKTKIAAKVDEVLAAEKSGDLDRAGKAIGELQKIFEDDVYSFTAAEKTLIAETVPLC